MKNLNMGSSFFDLYPSFKNKNLFGRYIGFNHLVPEMGKLSLDFRIEEIGSSVLKVPIQSITFGRGPKKILAWSQMHGNESTTTKSLFDLLNLFSKENQELGISNILENCTIKLIPMLNPDGAARYTRENVNSVDLNRDAKELGQIESRVLRNCFDSFQPDFCLNLHDQRTIFSAGDTPNPATLSFLAPALDEERSIPESRKKAMQLIAHLNMELQQYLPNQVGRFDDAFNINCTGDSFQSLGVPTILFEAGHFQGDYQREETRKFMALAIFHVLANISSESYMGSSVQDYMAIPENRKKFFDVILRNATIEEKPVELAVQFEERIKSGKISFHPVVKLIQTKLEFFGHQEIDCGGNELRHYSGEKIKENDLAEKIMANNDELAIKIE